MADSPEGEAKHKAKSQMLILTLKCEIPILRGTRRTVCWKVTMSVQYMSQAKAASAFVIGLTCTPYSILV